METRSKDRKRSLECTSRNTEKRVDSCAETNYCLSRGERDQHKQGKGFRLPGLSRSKQTNKKEKNLSEFNSQPTTEDLQPSSSKTRGTKRHCIKDSRIKKGFLFKSSKRLRSNSSERTKEMAQRGNTEANSDENRKSFESHSSSSSANDRVNVSRRNEGMSSPELHEASTSRRIATSSSLHGLLRRLGTGIEDLFAVERGVRTSHLLGSIRDPTDESQRLAALNDLCEYLSIGTEDSLLSFQIDSFVPALVTLLEESQSPDTMLLAARALSHMMEVLPHSAAAITHHGAPSLLCNTLLSIEYIDLAEQALTALEKMSREFPGPVLRSGGLLAVLSFIDFFSTGVQRTAASTAANLCRSVTLDAFDKVEEALPALYQLLSFEDSRIRESGITAFARLTDSFRWHSAELSKIFALGSSTGEDFPILTKMMDFLLFAISSLSIHTVSDILNLLSNGARGSAVLLKRILTEQRVGENGHVMTIVVLLKDLLEQDSSATCSASDVLQLADALVTESEEYLDNSNHTMQRKIVELYRIEVSSRFSDQSRSDIERLRRNMLLESPEILHPYGTLLFPQFIKLFKSSTSTVVKRQIMSCMRKFVGCVSSDVLKTTLFDNPTESISSTFIPFISSLLSFNGSKMENAFGTHLAVACMNSLKESLRVPFVREGVFYELRRLKERCQSSSEEDSANGALVQNIDGILEFYSESEACQSQNPFFESLREIGHFLSNMPEINVCPEEMEKKLDALLSMFHGEKTVSRFEMIQSDTISAVVNFFAPNGNDLSRKQRLAMFAKSARRNPEGFRNLIARTVDVLAATEDLPVISPDMTVGTALHLLHQPLKFKLKQQSRTRHAFSICASIEPLTSIRAIEKFVAKRLEQRNNTNLGSTRNRRFRSNTGQRLPLLRNQGDPEDTTDEDSVAGIEEGWDSAQESSQSYESPSEDTTVYRTLSIAEEEDALEEEEEEEDMSDFDDEDGTDVWVDQSAPVADVSEEQEEADEDFSRDEDGWDTLYNDALSSSLPAVELDMDTLSPTRPCALGNSFSDHYSSSISPQQQESYIRPSNSNKTVGVSSRSRICRRKLSFFMNGHPVPSHFSALMCVTNFFSTNSETEPLVPEPSLWDTFYTLEFNEQVVIEDDEDLNVEKFTEEMHSGQPSTVKSVKTPKYVSEVAGNCIMLLNDLFRINKFEIRENDRVETTVSVPSVVVSEDVFHSHKLSSKLIRQLSDPVILASASYPRWVPYLVRHSPFLFPFETRQLAFQLTYLGIARAFRKLHQRAEALHQLHHPRLLRGGSSLASFFSLNRRLDRYQDRESLLGRLPRQKEQDWGQHWNFILCCCSERISPKRSRHRKNRVSWKSLENTEEKKYTQPPGNGLFPNVMDKADRSPQAQQILELFHFMGKFCAKALLDGRLLDLRLSPHFLRLVHAYIEHKFCLDSADIFLSGYDPSLEDLAQVDPALASSLYSMLQLKESTKRGEEDPIENLCVYFNVPGAENVELFPDGSCCPVTEENVEEYVSRVCRYLLVDGVSRQVAAFCAGCEEMLSPTSWLQFMPEEFESLLCGPSYERWEWNSLVAATKCDHGYTHESPAVQYLFQVLSKYNLEEQRMFLTFVTGTPRLPIGGLSALNPRLTIVKRTPEAGRSPDECLPTVMTCTNYLKLPQYSSYEIAKERLEYAIREGSIYCCCDSSNSCDLEKTFLRITFFLAQS
ncbi:E3 ubiquitin-protein ligase TRIP12 [Galdieria sulphuraria]|nr:E3 ubiquitin-protein ligase TRIP12 [Galdieria sulphuraria]